MQASGPPITEWKIGKCVIRRVDKYVFADEYETVYKVYDYCWEWYGTFPTFQRAENYAKRESGNGT